MFAGNVSGKDVEEVALGKTADTQDIFADLLRWRQHLFVCFVFQHICIYCSYFQLSEWA